MKRVFAVYLFVILTHIHSTAASIRPAGDSEVPHLALSGEIRDEDVSALTTALRASKRMPGKLVLNSPGGSVRAALALAEIVDKYALATEVAHRGTCLSSCFFVFLAGWGRQASPAELMSAPNAETELKRRYGDLERGYIGVHRPFYSNSGPKDRQADLMIAVTRYLEQRLVPRRIIDQMMVRPSNDIYWLTEKDLEELGEYSPPLEEYLIKECGYDRRISNMIVLAWFEHRDSDATRLVAEEERSRTCQFNRLIDSHYEAWMRLRHSQKR